MHVSSRSRLVKAKKCTKKRDARAEVLVVYHWRDVFGKSGWKVNGKWLLESSQWKISESNGKSQNVVRFFRTGCSKRKFVFHFFKANFDTSFRLSWQFFGKWNWFSTNGKRDSRRKVPFLNFDYHLPNCEPISLPMWVVNKRCFANLNLLLFCCSHWRRRAVKQSKAGKVFFF